MYIYIFVYLLLLLFCLLYMLGVETFWKDGDKERKLGNNDD
jgi:hypothetical protein